MIAGFLQTEKNGRISYFVATKKESIFNYKEIENVHFIEFLDHVKVTFCETRKMWLLSTETLKDIPADIVIIENKKIYLIDEPNHTYEVSSKPAAEGYFYAVLYHPSSADIKLCKKENFNKTWFTEREDCLDARIKRAKRDLDLEIQAKERKI